jgi:WS/DGAT/MGAT family acyltransferase
MPYQHYDRLTALDTSFLDLESPGVHMHVGSVGIFDPGPMVGENGEIDFEQSLALVEAGLKRAPRFRQKLARTPVSGHPVWIDDEHFNVVYHVRHTALPLPGDERQLKRLAGRVMSQKLDRDKPMWELWFVEGLEGGRIAVISKVHHCLIDGISGVDLLGAFMGSDPEHRFGVTDHHWVPRPAPGPLRLLSDELRRRASIPGRLASVLGNALRRPEESFDRAAHAVTGFSEAIAQTGSPASETPLNVPIGPHRRFDWTEIDMQSVRDIRKKLGGTVNDVVLACVTGAMRQYLTAHELDVSEIVFRSMIPVSTRSEDQRGKLGNRVSMLIASLPVGEEDPRERLRLINEETGKLKSSGQIEGSDALEEVSDWTSTALLTGFTRMAASRRAANMVVTNVPGPQLPIYLNGARMLASYPLVPLFDNNALGIALFSYDGRIFWGFNADWDAVPDLHAFVEAVDREFRTLCEL